MMVIKVGKPTWWIVRWQRVSTQRSKFATTPPPYQGMINYQMITSISIIAMMTMVSRCKAEGNSLLVDPGQLSIVARRARQSLLDVQVTMITLVRNQRNSLDHQDCNFDLSRFRVQLFTPSSSPPPPSPPSPSPSSPSLSFCFCGDQSRHQQQTAVEYWVKSTVLVRLSSWTVVPNGHHDGGLIKLPPPPTHTPIPPRHKTPKAAQSPPKQLSLSSRSEIYNHVVSWEAALQCIAPKGHLQEDQKWYLRPTHLHLQLWSLVTI